MSSRAAGEAPLYFLPATSNESCVREHHYYVYILSSKGHRLYVGVTNRLESRVAEHKTGADPNSFTTRYKINRLVYFERFKYIEDAIRREKQIKVGFA